MGWEVESENSHLEQEEQDRFVSDLKTDVCIREGMWLGSLLGQCGPEHDSIIIEHQAECSRALKLTETYVNTQHDSQTV